MLFARLRPTHWIWTGLLMAWGCQTPKPVTETRFVALDAARTGVAFQNTLTPTFTDNILEYNYFYNGGGVATADFDHDGRTDLYFSGNQVSSRLYLNRGNFRFIDATKKAGVGTTDWCTGVAVADLNADGWPDLYVCHAGLRPSPNQLFINLGKQADGSVKFAEKAHEYGLDYAGFSTQAAFFDYDRDGDLDCYLLTHFHDKTNPNFPKPKHPSAADPTADRLYRNDGGHFAEVTRLASITAEGLGLGVAVADFNEDGWPDLYVSNDFACDDVLYLNQRNGTFADQSARAMGHTSRFSMGCAAADLNNDGHPDLVTLDMMPAGNARQKLMATALSNDLFSLSLHNGYRPQYPRNCLQLHQGNSGSGSPTFAEIGQFAGISQTDWSWSALLADLDNDGRKDLFVTNGIPHDITNADFVAYRSEEVKGGSFDYNALKKSLLKKVEALPPVELPNYGFRNRGDLTFVDESQAWGFTQPGCSNGAVYADLDNDGDLDLVTNNLNAPALVVRNQLERFEKNHFLRLRLNGQGIGAKLRVVTGHSTQVGELFTQSGFQSSQEEVVHFGLGRYASVDTLEVRWPSGQVQVLTSVRADQLLVLSEANAKRSPSLPGPPPSEVLLEDIKARTGLAFAQRENDFEEFNFEPLLPHRFSRQGPCLAVGDVNGDGLDDIVVGGPAKIPGSLFLQNPNSRFTRRDLPDPGFEDTGVLLFDADRDGDLDLYVVSGGNEYNPLTAAYQDRLYRNDGHGNFARDTDAIPAEFASGSCVAAADYDRDGDLDLFVGGRVVPTQYPRAAESFLLRNNGKGIFENVTERICPSVRLAGLVTSVCWSDYNGDGWMDLLVAGEWMPLVLFKNEKGTFSPGLPVPHSVGWWNSLAGGDFDGDGDEDFLAGNLGLNSRLKTSSAQPVGMYAADFDGNGTLEPVLTHWVHNREVPYLNRDALAVQYPAIKQKFPSHAAYSQARIEDLFSPEQLRGAQKWKANEFRSVYLENQGHGQFRMGPLPPPAQFAPIQAFVVVDLNHDGRPDVLAAGNSFDADYTTGRYDAGGITALINKGAGRFTAKPGFRSSADLRAIVPVTIAGKKRILVGSNSGPLRVLQFN